MKEKTCSNCNSLLWLEKLKYNDESDRAIEFKKDNVNISKINFDSDCDSVTLEILLSCKNCNEEETLYLNSYIPYGALNSNFN